MMRKRTQTISAREQKRLETHRQITQSALKLFGVRGYEETTLDDIAVASGISRRSFFNYFKSKEDILNSWQGDVPTLFHEAILAYPDETGPFETVQAILQSIPAHFDAQQAITIHRILRSNPQLRAGNDAKFVRLEEAVFEALCKKWPDPDQRMLLKMTAMTCIGSLRVAIQAWIEEGGTTQLAEHMTRAMSSLRDLAPHT